MSFPSATLASNPHSLYPPGAHCHLPTSTTLQSADSRAQTCPWACTSGRHPCAPRCAAPSNSHHSGPIETLFLRSKFKQSLSTADSSSCSFWPLVLLFPTADLVQSLILKDKQTNPKTNQKQCNGHRLFSLL